MLTNFAAQAVIAIENARLLNELRQRTDDLTESLEQQTATSEVLRVISSSPGELEPVFDAMLENATRICEADFGNLLLLEGEGVRLVAHKNAPEAYVAMFANGPLVPGPHTGVGRVMRNKTLVHIADVTEEPPQSQSDPMRVATMNILGARTFMAMPMLKDNQLIGIILIYRQQVRPFSDKQIELMQNFAAQAVIAIENTRLLNELRERTDDLSEALEQQTATSEVLRVISSSPGKPQPVFEAMLENATRICGAKFGTLYLCEDDGFRAVAMHNPPPGYAESRAEIMHPPEGTSLWQAARTREPAQVVDMTRQDTFRAGDPFVASAGSVAGYRSVLSVPMLKEGHLVGAISIFRRDVLPFNNKQVQLVTNFAAQAVIAIENARLLNELRQRTDDLSEALEQQTATSEVLKVISSSPGHLMPIFQSLLENATHICSAKFGVLWLREGDLFRAVAAHGGPPAYREILFRTAMRPGPDTGLGMLLRTKRFVQIDDITKGKAYLDRDPLRVATVELAGGRTLAEVPLLKDGELIGSINIYHQEVRPFTDKADRIADEFRRPGRYRHREHAPARRTAPAHRRSLRGAGAADRYERGAEGHLQLAR